MDKVFDALASKPRRQILIYLSASEMAAGDIAARFDMSKPAISKHLSILENAGLVTKERRGQFIHYALASDKLLGTLNGFLLDVFPGAEPELRASAILRQNFWERYAAREAG